MKGKKTSTFDFPPIICDSYILVIRRPQKSSAKFSMLKINSL